MRKYAGLPSLFLGLLAFAVAWEYFRTGESRLIRPDNMGNVLTYVGLFGILSLGQALVIITGGIDLSVGSVVALVSIVAAVLMKNGEGLHPFLAVALACGVAGAIGAFHGVLVVKARIQPFIVTLCGLFFYRGIARFVTGDTTAGFGNASPFLEFSASGYIRGTFIPIPFVIFLVLALTVGAFLHLTASGRHIFALGANEEAARFSGIRTGFLKGMAYVLCSLLSGIGGILIAFKVGSMGPANFGSFYELYAIAGVVLGGCSLRGGTGNIFNVVMGVAILRLLYNLVNILRVPSQLEFVVIGAAILIGVCIDEFVTRRKQHRGTTT